MSPQAQSIAKNTTFLTLAYIFQKLFAFVYFTLVARFIGATDIGVYTFAISLTTIFSVFIDFGLASVLTREISRYRDKMKAYLDNALTAKIILAVVAFIGAAVTVNLLGKSGLTVTMVYLAGLVMILDSFSLAFYAVFRAHQNLKYEAIGIAINQVLIFVVGLTGIYLKFPLYILVLALLTASTFNFFYSGILLKIKLHYNFKLIWDKSIIKTLFKIALPFALAGIFVRVYSYIDQVLLSVLIGDQTVGWYSVPSKITYSFQFIPAALVAAIYPAMSHCFVSDKSRLKKIFEQSMFFMMLLAIPTALGLAGLADKIIITLYTAEFLPSILALQIMIFAVIPIFMNYPSGSLLNSCDKQSANTANLGITMVINIILNILLIPYYQHIGAAVAALISQSVLFAINFRLVPKIVQPNYKFLVFKFCKSLISGLVMLGAILFFKPYLNFVILIILGGMVYLGVMYVIKGFTKEEVRNLLKAIFKKAVPGEETLGT